MTAEIPMPNLEGTGYNGVEDICRDFYQDTFRFILSRIKDNDIAADLTQITFEKFVRNIDHYVAPRSLRNWIFSIASNSVINYFREKKIDKVYQAGLEGTNENSDLISKHTALFNGGMSNRPEAPLSPQEEYLRAEGDYNALRSLKKIGNKGATEILRLRLFEDYSYEEISKQLNVPLGTVQTRVHRAKKQLKEILENNE